MPRFYINVYNDIVTLDEEGIQLPDLRAAQEQARAAAAELIAEQLKGGERLNLTHRIEVEDEDRRTLYTLPFSELVECGSNEE